MTNHLLKDLVNVAQEIAGGIATVAQEITHNIVDLTRSNGEKFENILVEKGISVTRESRHGRDCHNIVANSDGSFFTNNNIDFTRSLLNQVLFSDNGEERVAKAMSDQEEMLIRVQNPKQRISGIQIFQLAPNNGVNQ